MYPQGSPDLLPLPLAHQLLGTLFCFLSQETSGVITWVLEAGYAVTQTVTGWVGDRWRVQSRAAQLSPRSCPPLPCPALAGCLCVFGFLFFFFQASLSALSIENQTSAQCLLLTVCPSSDFLTSNTFISLGDISMTVCFVVLGQFFLFFFFFTCLDLSFLFYFSWIPNCPTSTVPVFVVKYQE